MKQEYAGTPWVGENAEALKERCRVLSNLKDMVDTVDMTQPDAFAAFVSNRQAIFMGELEQLPHIANAMMQVVMSLIAKAEEHGDKYLADACRGAVGAAIIEALQIEQDEVTENENSDSDVSN